MTSDQALPTSTPHLRGQRSRGDSLLVMLPKRRMPSIQVVIGTLKPILPRRAMLSRIGVFGAFCGKLLQGVRPSYRSAGRDFGAVGYRPAASHFKGVSMLVQSVSRTNWLHR